MSRSSSMVFCCLSLLLALCSLSLPASVLSAASDTPVSATAPAPAVTVHLVCHSHDDVGWQVTVDEYYVGDSGQADGVRDIINTVVASLDKNPERKFMYVEQAFFQRWWREQNETQRALAQRLVADKQLEFVNGGWSMHDEASTHYVDMVDQTTLGHRYITQQFGVVPTVTWQIDPFGHSATQAALFGPLSGMDAVFFARIDYQDKRRRAATRELEMVWRSSPSLGEKAQVFAGAFPGDYLYFAPPGFCYDVGCSDPVIQNNKSLPGYNLDTIVDAFVETALGQAAQTNGNNIMWTLGGDFEYPDAESWYRNLDILIPAVNADGRVKTQYSTPSIYVAAKNAEGLSWPLKTDDFFPYADGPDSFWTGYFTSRPALKGYVRQTSAFLQVVRHWEWMLGANGSDSQKLWEAQGVVQHHDGVSGTAKQAVTFDYAQRLSVGYDAAASFLTAAIADVVDSAGGDRPAFIVCPLLNISVCATAQNSTSLVVLLYNPSMHPLSQRVSVPVAADVSLSVVGPTGDEVPSQVQVTMPNIARGAESAHAEVQFVASLPPLGFTTYFVTQSSRPLAGLSTRSATLSARSLSSPSALSSQLARLLRPAAPVATSISNDFWTLTFDATTGFLSSATEQSSGAVLPIGQQFFYYNAYQGAGQDSGAYIFRPDQSNASAVPVARAVTNISVVTGPVVSEVRQVFGPWLTQIVRLTQGSPVIELEWTVGHIPVADGQGKEIISRFSSAIDSQSAFYTDSNGREFLKRVRSYRPTWNFTTSEFVAGNYYPCNAMAWLADANRGMAVLLDRTQGCASLQDGALELMVHRRLVKDDGRGVDEPLDEPGTDGLGLTVTGTHFLLLAPTASLAAQARVAQAQVFAPAQPVFAPLTSSVSAYIKAHLVNASASLDPAGLPLNVDLMTLQVSEQNGSATTLLIRLAHRFGVGEDDLLSRPAQVDLATLFSRAPSAVVELSLTANQKVDAHRGYSWKIKGEAERVVSFEQTEVLHRDSASFPVTVGPAEIRTFNVTFASSAHSVPQHALFSM